MGAGEEGASSVATYSLAQFHRRRLKIIEPGLPSDTKRPSSDDAFQPRGVQSSLAPSPLRTSGCFDHSEDINSGSSGVSLLSDEGELWTPFAFADIQRELIVIIATTNDEVAHCLIQIGNSDAKATSVG